MEDYPDVIDLLRKKVIVALGQKLVTGGLDIICVSACFSYTPYEGQLIIMPNVVLGARGALMGANNYIHHTITFPAWYPEQSLVNAVVKSACENLRQGKEQQGIDAMDVQNMDGIPDLWKRNGN